MKKRKAFFLLLSVLLVAAVVLYFMYFVVTADRRAPEIVIPEGQLELSIGDPEETLLEGVTARDNRKGDVTGTMVVETVKSLKSDGSAKAVLAAFDKSGNVAKAERSIRYTDYAAPVFDLKQPLLFKEDVSYSLLNCVTASDVIDGDITDHIKVTILEAEHAVTQAGDYKVRFRVTNSLGDTAYLDAPVQVYPADSYNAKVELTQYIVYIKAGERFSPENYFRNLICGVRKYAAGDEGLTIDIDNDVKSNTPGVYAVTYVASYGDYNGCSRLLVVVEE